MQLEVDIVYTKIVLFPPPPARWEISKIAPGGVKSQKFTNVIKTVFKKCPTDNIPVKVN